LFNQINNGRIDCEDASDECGTEEGSNSMLFHSRYLLIGNEVFFKMVWIMAVTSVAGNIVRRLIESWWLMHNRFHYFKNYTYKNESYDFQ